MHFLRVNVKFYDVVSMIHDVIRTANPFPYTAKFMFVGVRNNKLNKSNGKRYIEYVQSVIVYQKYLTRLGERLENYQFAQPRLYIFDIRQRYIRILYICLRTFTCICNECCD